MRYTAALVIGLSVIAMSIAGFEWMRQHAIIERPPDKDHEEVFGEISNTDVAGMSEAMREAMIYTKPKPAWVEARDCKHEGMLEIVTHTRPHPSPIKIATTSTSTKDIHTLTSAGTISGWSMSSVAPDATPTPIESHMFGKAMQDIKELNGHASATPRILTVPSGDKIALPSPPFSFKEMKFGNAATLEIEDTCNNDFHKIECLKIITPYEPIVQRMDEHWQVTFKKP